MLSFRNLNPSPKEVLVVMQVEKSDHLPWGSIYSKPFLRTFLYKSSEATFLRSQIFVGFHLCREHPLWGPDFLPTQLRRWEDLLPQFLSVDSFLFFFLIFLKGKRTALLFCWTTYSLIYNAGQQGLVSVYSGSSEDTRLFILKLDSS